MKTFITRTSGADLASLPFYNKWNGEYNPGFPEDAPSSVGGALSSKGNCTWYCWGRMVETGAFSPLPARPKYRGNASEWGTKGEPLSEVPVVGGVVVFGDNGYGHVAFIEKIENGEAYLSESSYSTRGNDFLFKYGRTIKEVCSAWGMHVLRYLAPINAVQNETELNLITENGTITVIGPLGSLMRSTPFIKTYNVVGSLGAGCSLNYKAKVESDGFMWVTDGNVYVARRKLDNSEIYADVDAEEVVVPPSVSDIGKYANFGGNIWLFAQANKDDTYPYPSIHQATNVRTRSAKIIGDENGRFQVSVPAFSPSVVWIANNQVESVTDSPVYGA